MTIPNLSSLTPTMSLPLEDWISQNSNQSTSPNPRTVDIPLDSLEGNTKTFKKIMQKNNSKYYGGENTLAYIIGELMDNVYEHSQFSRAYVLGLVNPLIKYSEIAIFDNGITIGGSFHNYGMLFYGAEAIVQAINGESSKDSYERGRGLGSIFRIIIQGLKGQLFIVSGYGAIFIEPSRSIRYDITTKNRLDGTLISLRVPYPSTELDIFSYVS